MSKTSRKSTSLLIILVMLVCTLSFAFFANETRKEIYFLCANFTQGTPVDSVIRQLDTAELSHYEINDSDTGSIIMLTSGLVFKVASCRIETDSDDAVMSATFRYHI
ncbi:hypothetical protein [Aestuariibacter salexigens]|uniref:hypothetical protein n=1 Tax=Aestuariibacter salexigens TaxID=226010 RepID=UPI00047A31D5|nr:hypothetical protein [Aestuariibacter salexigens]